LLELIVWHHLVDQAELQSLTRCDLWIAKPDFFRFFLANEVFQIPSPVAGIERAHHRPYLPKDGALLGNGEVTHDLQDITPADGETVDAGDNRFLQPIDRFVHLQRRESSGVKGRFRHTLLAATDAEELVSRPGDHH